MQMRWADSVIMRKFAEFEYVLSTIDRVKYPTLFHSVK